MSSSVFSVNGNTGDSGSSFSNLLPVNVINENGIHESVMLDANGLPSLPGLDEFCQNNDHVNAIYNTLGHSSNSELIPPELCVEHHSNNKNQEFRPANHGTFKLFFSLLTTVFSIIAKQSGLMHFLVIIRS
jgi:hypothetical protein